MNLKFLSVTLILSETVCLHSLIDKNRPGIVKLHKLKRHCNSINRDLHYSYSIKHFSISLMSFAALNWTAVEYPISYNFNLLSCFSNWLWSLIKENFAPIAAISFTKH